MSFNNPSLDGLFDQIIGYDLKWTYIPGKTNYLPDYLSRLPPQWIPPLPGDTINTTPVLPVTRGPVFDAIVQAGTQDPVVQFALECVQYGWPLTHAEFPSQMRFLWP